MLLLSCAIPCVDRLALRSSRVRLRAQKSRSAAKRLPAGCAFRPSKSRAFACPPSRTGDRQFPFVVVSMVAKRPQRATSSLGLSPGLSRTNLAPCSSSAEPLSAFSPKNQHLCKSSRAKAIGMRTYQPAAHNPFRMNTYTKMGRGWLILCHTFRFETLASDRVR